jgi:chemotaxis protein CheC
MNCEAISEVVNIGIGQAGDKLARLLSCFVRISTPRLRIVDVDGAQAVLAHVCSEAQVIVTRQAFSSQIRGEVLTVFDTTSRDLVAELVHYPTTDPDEMILEISNLIVATCLSGIGAQISYELSFSPPSILDVVREGGLALDRSWRVALIAELALQVEDRPFRARLFMFWADDALETFQRAAERLFGDDP